MFVTLIIYMILKLKKFGFTEGEGMGILLSGGGEFVLYTWILGSLFGWW